MIQQGINQLLSGIIQVGQPIVQRKKFIAEQAESQKALQIAQEEREKQSQLAEQEAFNRAQQESAKRVGEIIEAPGRAQMTDEQIEYAVNLQSNAAKAQFERNPTPETMKEWYAASQTKSEVMEQLAEFNWKEKATQRIKQDIRFEQLKTKLRKEAGLD